FDLDFTLAQYNTEFEELIYNLARDYMVNDLGYPEILKECRYDQMFPIRGLFLDKQLGNLLKVDEYGNIVIASHGRRVMSRENRHHVYKNAVLSKEDLKSPRYALLDTFFAAPESCLAADLVERLESLQAIKEVTAFDASSDDEEESVPTPAPSLDEVRNLERGRLSYNMLLSDLRTAMEHVHRRDGPLKTITMQHFDKYVVQCARLPQLLEGLRKGGKRTFVLTNSGYNYATSLLEHILGQDWRSFFDYVIVNAQKPKWFGDGTPLREVKHSGRPSVGSVGKRMLTTKIYQGGCISQFTRMAKLPPWSVLYCGDQLFGDIVKPKGAFWRTCLIVPEIHREIRAFENSQEVFDRLTNLEFLRSEIFRGLDIHCTQMPPQAKEVQKQIERVGHDIQRLFSHVFGSVFTTSWARTYYSSRVSVYTDLYTASVGNLSGYPPFYVFSAATGARFMPHEQTRARRHREVKEELRTGANVSPYLAPAPAYSPDASHAVTPMLPGHPHGALREGGMTAASAIEDIEQYEASGLTDHDDEEGSNNHMSHPGSGATRTTRSMLSDMTLSVSASTPVEEGVMD
ncbi:HAD-superfamily hydrolase, subfamily IG, 5'-nucleotidase, partial [Kipferlia bialata]